MGGTTTDILSVLLPVIVGGVIGVLGGIAGPPIAHWLATGAAKETRRIERFEQLLTLLHEHDLWLEKQRGSKVFGSDEPAEAPPLPRALALASVYFPAMESALSSYEDRARDYWRWMLSAAEVRLQGNLGKANEGFEEAYRPYRTSFVAILKELARFGRETLKL